MSETLELTVVTAQTAVEIFTRGGLSAVLDEVEKKVRAIPLDASTATGREQIRSVAYKVARTKTALDAEAKKLTEGWRASTALVNADRKVSQERLDALADEVRAPLTEFESKEKDRVDAHGAALGEMSGLLAMLHAHPNMTAALLEDHQRDFTEMMNPGRDWEEFGARAKSMRAEISPYLETRIATRKQSDANEAELARLRKEEAERQVREREEKLKAEAAEKARIEAERRAKAEADAEARRVVEAANKEAARVKAEAERIRAENERKQQEAEVARKREQDARELAERRAAEAETARVEALRRFEADKKAAEELAAETLRAAREKAKKDTEAAIVKERARVDAQRKAEEEAQALREADEAARARVRADIAEDLSLYVEDGSMFHAPLNAEEVINAIIAGKIRHVRVIW